MCLCSRCNWGMDTTLHVKTLSVTVVLHKTSFLNSYSYEHDPCSWQRKRAMLAGCQENVRPPAESLQVSAPSSLNHWGVSIKTKFPQISSGKLLKNTSFVSHTQGFNTHLCEQMKVASAKELSGWLERKLPKRLIAAFPVYLSPVSRQHAGQRNSSQIIYAPRHQLSSTICACIGHTTSLLVGAPTYLLQFPLGFSSSLVLSSPLLPLQQAHLTFPQPPPPPVLCSRPVLGLASPEPGLWRVCPPSSLPEPRPVRSTGSSIPRRPAPQPSFLRLKQNTDKDEPDQMCWEKSLEFQTRCKSN